MPSGIDLPSHNGVLRHLLLLGGISLGKLHYDILVTIGNSCNGLGSSGFLRGWWGILGGLLLLPLGGGTTNDLLRKEIDFVARDVVVGIEDRFPVCGRRGESLKRVVAVDGHKEGVFEGCLTLELIVAGRAGVKDAIVGSVVMKSFVDLIVDAAEESEINIECTREMPPVYGAPDLVMEVAECTCKGLDAVAGLAVTEATKEFESREGEGECWADRRVGEEAMLDETAVGRAGGVRNLKLLITN